MLQALWYEKRIRQHATTWSGKTAYSVIVSRRPFERAWIPEDEMPQSVPWHLYSHDTVMPMEFAVLTCKCGTRRLIFIVRNPTLTQCTRCSARWRWQQPERRKRATLTIQSRRLLQRILVKRPDLHTCDLPGWTTSQRLQHVIKRLLKRRHTVDVDYSIRAAREWLLRAK